MAEGELGDRPFGRRWWAPYLGENEAAAAAAGDGAGEAPGARIADASEGRRRRFQRRISLSLSLPVSLLLFFLLCCAPNGFKRRFSNVNRSESKEGERVALRSSAVSTQRSVQRSVTEHSTISKLKYVIIGGLSFGDTGRVRGQMNSFK